VIACVIFSFTSCSKLYTFILGTVARQVLCYPANQFPLSNVLYYHLYCCCLLTASNKKIYNLETLINVKKTCSIPDLVTVKVKVDSSLLIKISVSIKVIPVLDEGFYLFQNLNIKLPSTLVLSRKEVKRVLYFVTALTGVYLPPVLKLQ
jgi:hypothetical protein